MGSHVTARESTWHGGKVLSNGYKLAKGGNLRCDKTDKITAVDAATSAETQLVSRLRPGRPLTEPGVGRDYGWSAAVVFLKAPVPQKVRNLRRRIRREQHADVTVRQHHVIVESGNQRFAHGNGAVILLVEMREKLSGTETARTGNGAQRS
jgi:hypothetical protein